MDFLATISKMNRHTKYGALFAHVTAYTWAFFFTCTSIFTSYKNALH